MLALLYAFQTQSKGVLMTIVLTFLVVLLPGLITALVSTCHSKMLKTFLTHPSFFILPIFTYFTFSSSNKNCCCREVGTGGHLKFSVNASLCNMLISFLGSVAFAVITSAVGSKNLEGELIVLFVVLLLGFFLSLLFLCNAKPTSKRFNFCCCSSTCCSYQADVEYSVYKPDQPTKEFFLCIAADGSEEVLPAGEWEEEVELGELKEQVQEESRMEEPRKEEQMQEEPRPEELIPGGAQAGRVE